MKKLKKHIPIFIIFGIIGIIYRYWIFDFGIAVDGDWSYLHKSTLLSIYQSLPQSIWLPNNTFGAVSVYVGYYPTLYLYGLLANFFEFQHIERIVHLWPIVILNPISMYFLVSTKTKSNIARILGTLTYTLSSYFLVIQTGQLPLMTGFSFLPLIIYFYEKTLKKKTQANAYKTALVLFVQTLYEPRVTFITIIILFFYLVFWIILNKKQLKKTIVLGILPIILTALFNTYWILPLQFSTGIGENETLQRGLFGNEFLNIINALTTSHPFWTGGGLSIFKKTTVHPIFWILPFTALLALTTKKNKTSIIYFLLAIIGITLTKQTGKPFSEFYIWLFDNVPGFQAFREATKFFPITTLSFSVLIAIFVGKKKIKNMYKYPIVGLLCIYILIQTIPLSSGELGNIFQEQDIPSDYTKIETHIESNENYGRHLWIPETTIWSPNSLTHPMINSQKITENISELLNKESLQKFLQEHSIKYIILDNTGENLTIHSQILESKSYIQKEDWGLENFSVFSTLSTNALISSPTDPGLTYQQIHPGLYRIQKNATPSDIYVAENYHSKWKMVQGDWNWYNRFISTKEDISPTKTIYGLMTFENVDETELTLYFEPQKYFIFGSIISGIITILTIISLLITKKKRL